MEQFTKLTAKLSELFELEKADLDFGIHRIIKARQKKIQTFLSDDAETDQPTLKKIVLREMGEANSAELQASLDQITEKLKDEFGRRAFEGDTLTDLEALASVDGGLWKTLSTQLNEGASEANEQLEAEIYSHLTTFFSRYYSDADFLSQRRINAGSTPYAVPYSGEEVMLHWANKDQYYIKSSKDLKDYTFTLADASGKKKRVQFKCHKQDPVLNNNNAKREFHLADPEEAPIEINDDSLVIPFHYKIVEKTRTADQKKAFNQEFLAQLPTEWQNLLLTVPDGAKNDLLTRHLTNYTKKNESDFFIHKHLSKFLNQELDFYIKNEVMHLDDIDEKSADYLTAQVRKIKAIRTIAKHIITFLAQLENFQKKIWLKKKYVTETNYCITLDRIFERAPELIDTILVGIDLHILTYNGEMRSQHEEWENLYSISEFEDYPENAKLTKEFLRKHNKLMLDTAFFSDQLRHQILSKLSNFFEKIDGLLVHGENYQVLETLTPSESKNIDFIYTDPPYNTGHDGFIYKDNLSHSSWLSMIDSRSETAELLMTASGVFFMSIDERELSRAIQLLDLRFGKTNRIGIFKWNKTSKAPTLSKKIRDKYEYVLCYSGENLEYLRGPDSYNEQAPLFNASNNAVEIRFPAGTLHCGFGDGTYEAGTYGKGDKAVTLHVPLITVDGVNSKEISITARFKWSQSTITERIAKGVKLSFKTSSFTTMYYSLDNEDKFIAPSDLLNQEEAGVLRNDEAWKELRSLFIEPAYFDYCKPVSLIAYLAKMTDNSSARHLDYFAGSGTTGHAVINLNREDNGTRKYILVEMGDHFDTVLKPRLQKVVFSAKWKDGKPTAPETGISHAFKYLRLESYEDALNNLQLEDKEADLLGLDDSVKEDYLLSYMLDVETDGHLMNLERFQDPWGCQLKIHDPHTGEAKATTIDLIETFNYLMGFTLKELKVKDGFLTLEAENPQGEAVLIIWRKLADGEETSDWQTTTNPDLTNFIESRRINLADTEYAALYINGDHTLHDPHSKIGLIEDLFYDRMFANTGNPDD